MPSLLKKLEEKKVISKEEAEKIEEEARRRGKKTEEVILEKDIYPEKKLFALKSEITGLPLKEVEADEIPAKTLELIPEESAQFYKIAPLKFTDGKLEVGMISPDDLKAKEVLNFFARENDFSYEISLVTLSNFKEILRQYRNLSKEVSKALKSWEEKAAESEKKKRRRKKEEGDEENLIEEGLEGKIISEDAPIIKMVTVILKYAIERKVSDIHIEPFEEKSRVRFRVDGRLHSSLFLPSKVHPAVVTRIKIMSGMKIDEKRIPQDGRFSTEVQNKDFDFRVSTFPTSLGEKVVIRILASGEEIQLLEDLGFHGRNLRITKEAIKKPYGLVLTTGPTGSGKTTTLYSILNMLNREEVNIVTLEDPVEYSVKGVNHSQVKPEIGYTFAQGLRHTLRQDPDIIMVGEVRDEETASLVMHAAMTGHIVLSTLHTNSATGVIPRLVNMNIQSFLIPSALVLAAAQRLVSVLCPECKRKKKLPDNAIRMIEKEIENLPEAEKKEAEGLSYYKTYEGVGCKKCNFKGYKGRIGLYEVLEMTEELGELISETTSEEEVWKEAKRQGMVTLRQDGIIKALKGITSVEEVIRTTEEY